MILHTTTVRKRHISRVLTGTLSAVLLLASVSTPATPTHKKGRLAMEIVPDLRLELQGEMRHRVDRNIEHWLLRMPAANPEILTMFARRNRKLPHADLVPWAGEFAGKYLISAVQAMRMSTDARLKPAVKTFVDTLIASQAPDGYLGPWSGDRQLRGDCDLWGHYHCMLGLLMWHDATGDQHAYACVQRAAECICKHFLDGTRRPIDTGNPNFNLAVYHVFAELYRRTGSERYLAMVHRIEEDLQRDGDWLRKGIEGVPYYQLPGTGPRWEALHIVQGFATMYEATGDERYRTALLSHWRCIRDLDRHPSGAFSTNEQASGTIFEVGPIETCCSVAWMALTLDALRLTGDPTVADELELTQWNEALAAQHPSGSWCTYDTPLNGTRAPSYHEISFQYRPGAPELNCCSVNAPRMLGILSEWAVTRDGNRLAVNFYGPGATTLTLHDGVRLHLTQRTHYPVSGTVRLDVDPSRQTRFALLLRIPAWSQRTRVSLNSKPVEPAPAPGTYLTLERTWSRGDTVELALDMTPRYVAGRGPLRGGHAAIQAGPLLLAFDAAHNPYEVADLAPVDVSHLIAAPVPVDPSPSMGPWRPMGLWQIRTGNGQPARLCDFASAGANGTEYAAWIPASHLPPAPTNLALPATDAIGKPGPILFRWAIAGSPTDTYDLVVGRDPECAQPVIEKRGLHGSYVEVDGGALAPGDYYWCVYTHSGDQAVPNQGGARRFRVDSASAEELAHVRDDGAIFAAPLNGNGMPAFGRDTLQEGLKPAADRHGVANAAVAFDEGSKLRFAIPFVPEDDYSFAAWICPESLPAIGMRQVLSLWCKPMDDPLRIVVQGDEISARIEAAGAWGTEGIRLEAGVWIHVVAVKRGATLTLYIGGRPQRTAAAPDRVRSASMMAGIGFNPLYAGGEHFIGKIDDATFYARALTTEEVQSVYQTGHVGTATR